jgi:hypothetical protein
MEKSSLQDIQIGRAKLTFIFKAFALKNGEHFSFGLIFPVIIIQ